jgi:hypothetical protein
MGIFVQYENSKHFSQFLLSISWLEGEDGEYVGGEGQDSFKV